MLAWRLLLEGARLKGALLLHLCFAVAVLLLIWGMAWFRVRHGQTQERQSPIGYSAAGVTAVAAAAVTGHLGGIVRG